MVYDHIHGLVGSKSGDKAHLKFGKFWFSSFKNWHQDTAESLSFNTHGFTLMSRITLTAEETAEESHVCISQLQRTHLTLCCTAQASQTDRST
ncbi:hypothetical protein BaRGS_00001044 [Batillaria attramentaria]|uniref:Uncharacterized protein n=1 Tax=Batillaria attramentaria TaxID=370345 RepID=A0ABD0M8B7_9CAEN